MGEGLGELVEITVDRIWEAFEIDFSAFLMLTFPVLS